MPEIFASLDPFFETGEIMGRSVANEGFLRALMEPDPFAEYHFFVQGELAARRLSARFAKEFPRQEGRGALRVSDRSELPDALARNDYHCFHLSDCINNPAWLAALRNRAGRQTFPITSLTHSLSYARYPQAFLAHIWPGATSRDCVVGTSRAAVKVVEKIYANLRGCYGLDPDRFPQPALEKIPLGVDTKRLLPPDAEERQKARRRLGIRAEEVMILVFGRFSHHSKMDLLPVFRALQRLSAKGIEPSRLRLVFGGWCGKKERMLDVYRELAGNLGLKLDLFLCPEQSEKRELYAAADIFLSPADNPQETFGISVAEAGACGLPAVASDYDGYRDIIVHGGTGFLAPVISTRNTAGLDACAPLVFDTQTHLKLAQRNAVDVAAMAEHLALLIIDPGLRLKMGAAARKRIEAEFSWQSVVENYLKLWDELWSRPVDPEAAGNWRHPQMMDYGTVFSGHPGAAIGPDDLLEATSAGHAVYRGLDHVIIYDGVGREISEKAIRMLLFKARKPMAAGDLEAALVEAFGLDAESCESLVLWALKHDMLGLVRGEGA